MFQAQSQTWSSASPGDPCGLNTTARYGVNAAINPNAAQARALCSQIMGPVGAAVFYDPSTVQPNGNSALWFVNAVGNPNVAPEEATTWTAGFVFQPSSDKPLLEGFTATVDFYEISIADMIAVEPGAAVYEACLSAASNPTFSIANPACQRIIRNPATGGATASNVSYINAGDATISGVDFAADWRPNLRHPWAARHQLPRVEAARSRDAGDGHVAYGRLDRHARPRPGHVVEQRRVSTIGSSRRRAT